MSTLKFASTHQALQYLADSTGNKIRIAQEKSVDPDLNKMSYYVTEALDHIRPVPARLAYGIGFFQKNPKFLELGILDNLIKAERLAKECYEEISECYATINNKIESERDRA